MPVLVESTPKLERKLRMCATGNAVVKLAKNQLCEYFSISQFSTFGRKFALDGLLLPRLPAGRGVGRAPWDTELPTAVLAGCRRMRVGAPRTGNPVGAAKVCRALARRKNSYAPVLTWLAQVVSGRPPPPGLAIRERFRRHSTTCVNQARPILRPGGRQASRPLRLQPLEPGARGFHRPSGAGRLGRA